MVEDTPLQQDFVRLVDFGIAKLISGTPDEQKLTKTGDVFGSLVYMSPEQCMGKALDGRSDIYSLGCVLYELLSGELPFLGATVFETMTNHIMGTPPDLLPLIADLPGARTFEMVYKNSVAKEPEKRYQTAADFRRDLAAALQHE
jgi:eukaryotic-like serine/threonine-protein kinase